MSNYEIQIVEAICEQESVPPKFAYKILKKLIRASIIKSFRGKSGGYKLVKDLESISLYDVILSMGGDISLNHCMKKGVICPNNSSGKECLIHGEFCRIQILLEQALKKRSIGEILQKTT